MTILIETLGWAGAVAVLGAYALLSMGRFTSRGYAYHGLNLLGSLLLGVYALCKEAYASIAVNAVWFCIGLAAIAAIARARRAEK